MLSVIFWSIWRRCYGEGKFKKYLSRTSQTIIAIALLTMQLTTSYKLLPFVIAFGISVWIIIEYWSRAIGEIIDAGLNHNQDASSYNRWFRKPLDLIYDKLGCQKHIGFYDFWYALIRYGIGVLPLFYYSWIAVFLVPFQYTIYLICHKLFIRFPNLYNSTVLKNITLNEPKNVAEIIHGGLFGLIVGLM